MIGKNFGGEDGMRVPVISIIGTGNMGNSLISGLINHNHPKDKLWATDVDEKKLAHIKNNFHIHTTTDNSKAVEQADIVILAIKPQLFAEIIPT
jgi:pyrroline-5-carboxylate reductase